jgi:pilus assembly protein CpaE
MAGSAVAVAAAVAWAAAAGAPAMPSDAIAPSAAPASPSAPASFGPHGAERPRFVAYVTEEASETALRGGLLDTGVQPEIRRGDVAAATRALERDPTPDVLLVDITGHADPAPALEALAAVCMPDVCMLVVGDRADLDFYRLLTRELGVAEYLKTPLTRDGVARLLAPYLAGAGTAEAAQRGGHIIAVGGARGGAGTSTIAVNLALLLAEAGHGHVAVVDLHLRGGTCAMMLGARCGTGLRVALEEPDRVDALFLDRTAVPVADRVRLIAAEEPMDAAPRPSLAGLDRVLDMLRHRFNHVVVDIRMPPGMIELKVMAASRHKILVTVPHVAGMRDAVALRQLMREAGSAGVLTVLNRAGQPGGLSAKLVEEALGGPPEASIPDLPRQLPRAANLGRPALGESAALRRSLAPLAQEILAEHAVGRRAGLGARLRDWIGRG